MNKDIMRIWGFNREVDLIESGKCPDCERDINMHDFTSDIALREFNISGLCQYCQNKIFSNTLEDDEDLNNLFEMIDSGRYSYERYYN